MCARINFCKLVPGCTKGKTIPSTLKEREKLKDDPRVKHMLKVASVPPLQAWLNVAAFRLMLRHLASFA